MAAPMSPWMVMSSLSFLAGHRNILHSFVTNSLLYSRSLIHSPFLLSFSTPSLAVSLSLHGSHLSLFLPFTVSARFGFLSTSNPLPLRPTIIILSFSSLSQSFIFSLSPLSSLSSPSRHSLSFPFVFISRHSLFASPLSVLLKLLFSSHSVFCFWEQHFPFLFVVLC